MSFELQRTLRIIIIIASLAGLAYVLGSKRSETTAAAQYEAANSTLRRECDSLQQIVNALRAECNVHYAAIDSLQRAIDKTDIQITQNRTRYENRHDSIAVMPDSELYRTVADYIEGYGSPADR